MEQQVTWAAGRGLTFIRVVQLSLSVLNRLMILKGSIKVSQSPAMLPYFSIDSARVPQHFHRSF
jgi:hypothetical protein